MKYRILIIDDTVNIHNQVEPILTLMACPTEAGYTATPVHSFVAGLLYATRQHFDLVLAFLGADGNGLRFAQDLSVVQPHLAVILFHHYSTAPTLINQARALGVRTALHPQPAEALRALVAHSLRKPAHSQSVLPTAMVPGRHCPLSRG